MSLNHISMSMQLRLPRRKEIQSNAQKIDRTTRT